MFKTSTSTSFRYNGLQLPDRAPIMESLSTLTIDGGIADELRPYLHGDLDRFLYTVALVPEEGGKALEIGANPYFTTALLRMQRPQYALDLVNYFGEIGSRGTQQVKWVDTDGRDQQLVADYHNVNIEAQALPFDDSTYDLVLFCEVIEHLVGDPLAALREISRVMKPGGRLVLTTPNVCRMANVMALLGGSNIYDQYSGHGPHGRHNREYTRHELFTLLTYCGFESEIHFTSDIDQQPTWAQGKAVLKLLRATPGREHDLGTYLFTRWRKVREASPKLPSWLYRSYPAERMA